MSDRSPSPIPAISDGVVEAAVRAFFCAAPDEDENEFAQCYIDSMRAAISAAILADREEQCIDIESLKAENADLVKLSRANSTAVEAATETITHLRADREASRAEIERLKAELTEASRRASLAERREATSRKFWVRDAKEALAGKPGALTNRIELCELPPVRMERDPLDGSALLVFDEQQQKAEDDEIDRLTQERDSALSSLFLAEQRMQQALGRAEAEAEYACNVLNDLDEANAEISRLKEQISIAEQATRTALESIPIAMTAAVEKEREACAKIAADHVAEYMLHHNYDLASGGMMACKNIAAAIRNRGEAK